MSRVPCYIIRLVKSDDFTCAASGSCRDFQGRRLCLKPHEVLRTTCNGALFRSRRKHGILQRRHSILKGTQGTLRPANRYFERLALTAKTFLTDSLSVNSLCHLLHHQFPSSGGRQTANHSPRKRGIVLLDIDVGDQPSDSSNIPRDEREIRNSHLVPD